MDVLRCIQNVGQPNSTFSSRIISTSKNFFDPRIEKERENERILHAKKINSFLRNC